MKRIGFLIWSLLALLTLSAKAQDCTTTKVASFDLERDSNDAILVPVKLDDSYKYLELTFIGDNSLDQYTVDELKLSTKKIGNEAITMFGERITDFVQVPSLMIGPSSGKNLTFVVLPQSRTSDSKIAGSLGMDVLANYDIDLDFPNQKVNLFLPSKCGEKRTVYWTSSYAVLPLTIQPHGNFTFPGQINGSEVVFSFSGTTENLFSLSNANRLFGLTASSPGMARPDSPTLAMPFTTYKYTFKDITVGGFQVSDPTITLYDDMRLASCHDIRGCTGAEANAAVSLNQLKSLHLYLAFKTKKMFLSEGP